MASGRPVSLNETPCTERTMFVRLDSRVLVAAPSSGWSFENESTKNAVTIAEKRPIFEQVLEHTQRIEERVRRTKTSIASNPPFHLSIVGSMISAWDLPSARQAPEFRASP